MNANESKIPNLTYMILQATERLEKESKEPSYKSVTGPPEAIATEEKHDKQSYNILELEVQRETTVKEANIALSKAEGLVGNQPFKELCREISARAPSVLRNKTQRFFFSTSYLFAVNTGNGYKTSLSILEELTEESGLFRSPSTRSEYVLPSPTETDVTLKMNNIIGTLEYAFSAPKLVVFDITSWLGHTGEQNFKNLLMQVFQKNTQCLVVFRIPYVREKLILETNADLSDIISTRNVVFEPFTKTELREIAERIITPYGMKFSPDALEAFDRQIDREKRNGYFYGIHTVQKVVGDFIRQMELESGSDNQNNLITGSMINRITDAVQQKDIEPGFDYFADMIGIDKVETQLREALYQIQFARRKGIGKPCMHMFFIGNPGTGKTTVARLLGNEMKKQGVLRIGKFFEHKGRDLCAEYVGQTTPKTVAICKQAYGSVLFIDEAYSLASGGGQNDYGKEAVDALIAEMENHYDDLVVIFAGYPEDMEKLHSLNPGMRSRVPYTIEFPNYSREDLAKIFARMSAEHFVHAPEFDDCVAKFFMNLPQSLLDNRSFGNARFVRNLYERVWGKATARCARNGNANIELTVEDFNAAVAEFNLA